MAVVLLGPTRLPQVARQLSAGLRRAREIQQQMEQEVRRGIPDLPSSQDVVRFARSPLALLDRLAEGPAPASHGGLVEDPSAPPPPNAEPFDAGPSTTPHDAPGHPAHGGAPGPNELGLDDPGMN